MSDVLMKVRVKVRVRVFEMSLNGLFGPKLHIWFRAHVLQISPLMIFRL